MKICIVALLGLVMIGCAKTQTYDISVKNDTQRPITLWLTKEGGGMPMKGWRSPEDLAINTLADDEKVAGVIVEAGQTASSGNVQGTFERGTYASLRIYGGEQKFTDLLAISRGSPNRIDYPISPGKTDLVVTDSSGRLAVQYAR
jgi:hypothetical protein